MGVSGCVGVSGCDWVCECVCECGQLFGNFFLNLSRLSETILMNKLTTQIIIKSGFLWEFGPG